MQEVIIEEVISGKKAEVSFREDNVVVIPRAKGSCEDLDYAANFFKGHGIDVIIPKSSEHSLSSPEWFEFLGTIRREHSILITAELFNIKQADLFAENIDIIKLNSSKGRNIELLEVIMKLDKPIIIERDKSSSIEECLNLARRLLQEEKKVIIYEREMKTFIQGKNLSPRLPIIIDLPFVIRKNIPESCKAVAPHANGLVIDIQCDFEGARVKGVKKNLCFEKFLTIYHHIIDVIKG